MFSNPLPRPSAYIVNFGEDYMKGFLVPIKNLKEV